LPLRAVEVSSVNSKISKVIWRRFVIHRWIFSWTTSPLNPPAAGAGTFDSVLKSGRSSSGAPGEIPGEIHNIMVKITVLLTFSLRLILKTITTA